MNVGTLTGSTLLAGESPGVLFAGVRLAARLVTQFVVLPRRSVSGSLSDVVVRSRRYEPMHNLSDQELVELARASDPVTKDRCLEELYSRHYATVVRWCLRLTGDQDQASDLAQECFLKAHRALDSFRGGSQFSTWLYVIARRAAINRGQRAETQRTQQLDEVEASRVPGEGAPADEALAQKERAAVLHEAVNRVLEPLEQQVLRLRFGSGLSLPEITRLLSLDNRSGAKAYLLSAKRKLRKELGPESNEQLEDVPAGSLRGEHP